MSWIFGVISKSGRNNFLPSSIIEEEILFNYSSSGINIIAGGNPDNLFFNSQSKKKYLVSGVGLSSSSELIGQKGWESIINSVNPAVELKNIDGHFAAVNWSDNTLNLTTDVIGLRDIYLFEDSKQIIFSTNPVWFSKITNLEIDFTQFSSRWLLFNQISGQSIFENVTRITSGQSVYIDLRNYSIETDDYNFLPVSNDYKFSLKAYSEKLNKLTQLKLNGDKELSLSLSGGMDSRVILSFLLNSNTNFDTHTFGNPAHPDSIIAKKITDKYSLKHEQIDLDIPPTVKLLKEISRYTAQTLVNNPASAVLQLQNYYPLKGKNKVIIDGGFGEIWRREFFYKLFLRGRTELLNNNAAGIIPYLRLNRADIFSDDILTEMEFGLETQLNNIIEKMPPIQNDNIGNWLDLFAI